MSFCGVQLEFVVGFALPTVLFFAGMEVKPRASGMLGKYTRIPRKDPRPFLVEGTFRRNTDPKTVTVRGLYH